MVDRPASPSRMASHRERRKQAGFKEVNIWLDDELRQRLDAEVKAGRYESRSEAVSKALGKLLKGSEMAT